ncbi:uncharacterized protein [Spinacia oleracea]|uniref:Transposase Tnp1/En/Spm-like domain-containing protein n=1 Tax=Spinacia oleracea TaxID=3562 RepID=A0ABM3QP37_SPIOL|nr:uncharacterized protein LOC110805212 [Spinacia oleracea]
MNWERIRGKKPTLVDVFHATRKKGTNLPNAETTQKYEEIQKIMEEEPTLSHVQVAQKVFKSKSRDRVLGFGGGITLKELSGPQPSRAELQSKLNEANKQNHVLTNRVDTVQEENNALKSRMSSVEEELNAFKEVFLQRFSKDGTPRQNTSTS